MWISREVYLDLRDQLASTTATRDALFARVQAQDVSMSWLTVHVSQLEHERTILLKNYLGVTVPPLTINQVKDESGQHAVDASNHFDDVGDAEAQRMGIDWNPLTGEVNYNVIETK